MSNVLNLSRRTPRVSLCLLLVAATALSACGGTLRNSFKSKSERVTYEGFRYKTKSQKVSKEARDHFTVTVGRANQSLSGARLAGAHEATKYCIKEYGTSKMDWVIGPETETVIPVNDKVQFEGYCRP